MGTQVSAVSSSAANTSPMVRTLKGKVHGGQSPVSNGLIAVYAFGTSGYGSQGTLLTTGAGDSDGNYNVSFTCPADAPNTPIYVLSIGGVPGLSLPENPAITEAAGLGSCSSAVNRYVVINEISTVALAYSLSHFFTTGSSDGNTTDFFGSPASLQPAISRVTDHLLPTLLDTQNSVPMPSTATFTNEGSKIITLADILGACVNSSGPGSAACTQLFAATTPPGGNAPTDVLQAAVNMALFPSQNVASLYSLVPPAGSSAFDGSLAAQPNDLSVGVSYTQPSLGLGIQSRSLSTLDIDSAGRVWMPSNLQGAAGIVDFDPSTASFGQLYTAPGLVDPQQVAIDINGTAWVNDMGSDVLAAFPLGTPTAPQTFTLPGYTSQAVTVLDDNSIRVSVVNASTNEPALAQVTAGASPTYSVIPNTTVPGSAYFIDASLAGDLQGGFATSGAYLPTPGTFDYYVQPDNSFGLVLYSYSQDAGQIVFTGNNFVGARGGYNAADDGLCIFTFQSCFSMVNQSANRHPEGLAVDGAGALWVSDLFTGDVQEVPLSNGGYLNGNNQVNNLVYVHDGNNGGTMHTLAGIGIDATGNVWSTNESCDTNGCTPLGGLVLSELIGAGTPTINPVSAQVVLNSAPGNEPQARKAAAAKK